MFLLINLILFSYSLLFSARLHLKIHGINGPISKTTNSCQIIPTSIVIHVGLREKLTKTYTISSGWNKEEFSFDLTFHEHLFWNLQVRCVFFNNCFPQIL